MKHYLINNQESHRMMVDAIIDEAVNISKDADVIVIMAGLTESFESEGFNR